VSNLEVSKIKGVAFFGKSTFLLLFFYSQVTYGHITPVVKGGNPKHCLTWGTNHDDPTLISDDICSFKDDESQSATFFSTVTYSDDAAVFMGGPNGTSFDYYITMSEDGAVHLNPGTASEGTTVYYLGNPPFTD